MVHHGQSSLNTVYGERPGSIHLIPGIPYRLERQTFRQATSIASRRRTKKTDSLSETGGFLS
jgi:hypothetical protein